MTRSELIRLFVLNSMTDDYEDIVQIMKETDEDASAIRPDGFSRRHYPGVA